MTETEGTEGEGAGWNEGWFVACTGRKKKIAAGEREIKTKRQGLSATEGETVTIPKVKIALDKTNRAGLVESKSSQTPKGRSQVVFFYPQSVGIKMTK